VIIYTGEIIEHHIDFMREGLRLDETFYNFGLNEGGAVDARFMGNKSRFINHEQGAE
jgi:SET domain-containing protein